LRRKRPPVNPLAPGLARASIERRIRIRAVAAEWARQDSNLHATGYEPAALAVELRAPGRILLPSFANTSATVRPGHARRFEFARRPRSGYAAPP
jgi:hypothetical protein